jgi:predicted metal-dependent peptidase
MTDTEPAQVNEQQRARCKSALNTVMKDHPFFAPAAVAMPLIEDRRIPTACTDGFVIRYNPDFVATLNDYELVGLIIHEVCHPLFGHLIRFASAMQAGDGRLVNKATDYEINNLLIKYSSNSFKPIVLPKDGCVDIKRFNTQSAEVIYRTLREEQEQEPPPINPDDTGDTECDSGGEGDEGEGEGTGSGSSSGPSPEQQQQQEQEQEPSSPGEFEIPKGNPEDIAQQEEKWREILSTSIHASKLRGDAPGEFLEELQRMQKSPINMKDVLQKYADEFCMDEGSTKPDKRFLANHDMYVSGMEDERIGSLVFVNDTSGSMPSDVATICCSVIQDAVNTLNADRVIHLDVDTRVAHSRVYAPFEPVDTEIHGRGGTDFRPAFEWVQSEAHDARVIVYLTDGYGEFPDTPPHIPVLWLTWGKDASEYPFGDVIDLYEIHQSTT